MAISSKGAGETYYWLRFLRESKVSEVIDHSVLIKEFEEIKKC